MKFKNYLLILIFFFSEINLHSQSVCFDRIKKEAKSISKIEKSSGTGFFINSNLIVTNRHVIERAENIEIAVKINDTIENLKAEILIIDKNNDLAILQISENNLFKSKLSFFMSSKEMNIGDKAYVLGFPSPYLLGTDIKLSEGLISSTSGFRGDKTLYQISAPIQPGNSGSPLIDELGNTRGIVVSSYVNGQLVNYAVKSHLLSELIDEYNRNNNNSKITIPQLINNQPFLNMIGNEAKKVCQILTTRKKHYFEELDIYIPKEKQDWTFEKCNDNLMDSFCENHWKSDEKFEDTFEDTLWLTYYYRKYIDSADRGVGFKFYEYLYYAYAQENLIKLVEKEYPIERILSNEIDPLALEMFNWLVFNYYWESYLVLYSTWDNNKLNYIYNYSKYLHKYYKSDNSRNYLLAATYKAIGHIKKYLPREESYSDDLRALLDEYNLDVANGNISNKEEIQSFRDYIQSEIE